MKIYCLVMPPEDVDRAKEIRAHAWANPFTLNTLMELMNENSTIGDDPNFRMETASGIRIVYSVERQPDPAGWTEHISMSYNGDPNEPKFPHPDALIYGVKELFQIRNREHYAGYVEAGIALNLLFQATPEDMELHGLKL